MIRKLMLWLAAVAALVPAGAAEMVTQGKTMVPLALPAARDNKAQFVELRPEALQMGLGEVVLHGSNDNQTQPDGSTRVTVRWHSIATTSNMGVSQPLQAPLSSQFRTTDKQVPPNTQIKIKGDLDLLAEDFLKLKAKLAKDSPRDIQRQTNNNNTTTETGRNANELAPSSGGGGGSSYGNSPYSLNNNNDKMKADLITTQWQDCQPRIDRTAGKVFSQARKLEVTESGRLMGTGNCEDHGNTADIVRIYDKTCIPVVDIENRKVYHQYLEYAQLDDKRIDVAACTADFTKFDAVKSTNENCGYRHDFNAGRSILQERLFYNDLKGEMVEVRSCGDSTQAFAQYVTQNTCPPTFDAVNKQVFINQRVAFMDGNGAEQYATDCKPDGNPALAVKEAFCDPKYEHDFVNHASYYRTRNYYVDQKGNTVYLAECGRSAADSFAHIFQSGSCAVRNDDALMMTYWKKITQITTPSDGTITIADCQEVGSPTPYAFVGPLNGAQTQVATNTFYPGKSVRQVTPGVDWSNSNNTFKFSGGVWCSDLYNNYFVGVGGVDSTVTVSGDGIGVGSTWGSKSGDRTFLTIKYNKYMRGDGTYYQKEYGRNYYFQVGCHASYWNYGT